MKHLLGATATLGVAIAIAACQPAQSPWITFHDPGGAFVVDIPQPAVITDTPMKAFGVSLREYSVAQPDGGGLEITVADFTLQPEWSETEVIGTFVALTEERAAQVLSDAPVELNGHTGREIVFIGKLGGRVDYRVFYVGQAAYQVMSVTAKTATAEESAADRRFQTSFRFSH